jgi:2-polyprenyl-3-methyl-5-hydroxy-6-metoxy-1,4-benzoquinol methylase
MAKSKYDLTSQSYWSQRHNGKPTTFNIPRRRVPAILKDILNFRDEHPNERRRTVCEIGCAPGSKLLQMASVNSDVEYYGIDYSESGIATTREVIQGMGLEATLLCADYFSYLPEEPFDLVVSFGVIEHASNPVDAVRRHADYARAGGRVALSIPNWGSPIPKWMAQRVDPTVFDSHNLSIMSPAALEDAMDRAGLVDVQIKTSGLSKLRTTCPVKTVRRMSWRTVAKVWNGFARILPSGMLWSATLWAMGRKV